jgi:hypothetical protein
MVRLVLLERLVLLVSPDRTDLMVRLVLLERLELLDLQGLLALKARPDRLGARDFKV